MKFLAVYDTPFWRESGHSGQVGSDRGPASATFDNSPPDGSPGILLGFVLGAWTSFGRWLTAPHGLVHWAGSETATRNIGSMDGAVSAGERAAAEVITALGASTAARPESVTAQR